MNLTIQEAALTIAILTDRATMERESAESFGAKARDRSTPFRAQMGELADRKEESYRAIMAVIRKIEGSV